MSYVDDWYKSLGQWIEAQVPENKRDTVGMDMVHKAMEELVHRHVAAVANVDDLTFEEALEKLVEDVRLRHRMH